MLQLCERLAENPLRDQAVCTRANELKEYIYIYIPGAIRARSVQFPNGTPSGDINFQKRWWPR